MNIGSFFLLLCLKEVCAVNFKLAIIHTNDIEARFAQTDKYGMDCSDSDAAGGRCFAGVARRASKIKELRNDMTNTILLDAGDQFQGTVWYTHYKGAATAYFMNKLHYTAMGQGWRNQYGYSQQTLGNREFDDGIGVLDTFARNLTFPLLSSNLNIAREPRLQGHVLKSTVLNVANERIGVIGYTTTKTAQSSMPGDTVSFDDIIVAVRREADALTATGVNKIIALGHAGFEMDKKIAKEVSNIDIVVGGHSYTFLYTGKQPSNEKPMGPYPTVVKSLDGIDVPVVTAFRYGKYLGHIILDFNSTGNVVRWEGSPILLDNSTTQDADVLADVERFSGPVDEYKKESIGSTRVYLEGDTWFCRAAECNMGNLFTDALVWFYQSRTLPGKGWTDAVIAIVPGGGIREPINIGPITLADLTTTFPYGNQIDIISMKGEHLYEVLEYCASRFSLVKRFGGFLQMSGMHVKYDMNRPIGSRVVSAKVLCTRCNMPTYYPINRTEVYRVIMDDYLIKGGDGYTSIKDNYISRDERNNIDVTILAEYIRRFTPIVAVADGRIEFVEESECSTSSATRSVTPWHYLNIILLTATILVQCS